jgi:hypothetical protein
MVAELSVKMWELRTEIAYSKKILKGLDADLDGQEIQELEAEISGLIEQHDLVVDQINALGGV